MGVSEAGAFDFLYGNKDAVCFLVAGEWRSLAKLRADYVAHQQTFDRPVVDDALWYGGFWGDGNAEEWRSVQVSILRRSAGVHDLSERGDARRVCRTLARSATVRTVIDEAVAPLENTCTRPRSRLR